MVEAISSSSTKYPSCNSSVLKMIIGSSEVPSAQAPSSTVIHSQEPSKDLLTFSYLE
ncbi:hypothetical protein L873DRAFT_1815874 [Choiromyces venosus 120613-1]|uniref:Uncharacterized protein n=1 Tax=Choiromyces venosus 120613-1 TaxID=1336337 RepID=A0A3N4JAF4_9PEZI|nr:hypothetical protein L873DRAFT_1815874 [Choiromyces venosus 120613-1]